mmetsp:Transcript_24107/g.21418  ORF Transcript_24107/g.21418 Transcript_24107/m.21418 type:complete len:89 (+) Transcript_24107:580-846(+)
MNKNYIIDHDKQNDQFKDLKDVMAIEKGDYIKQIRIQKKEYENELIEIRIKIKTETENYINFKKYSSVELKLMKQINSRLKVYINTLK